MVHRLQEVDTMRKHTVCDFCETRIPMGQGYQGTIQILKKGNPFVNVVSRVNLCNDCGRLGADKVRKEAEAREAARRNQSSTPER